MIQALPLLVFALVMWLGGRAEVLGRARVEGVVRHFVVYDDHTLENPDWQAIRVRGVRAIKLHLADGTCRMLGGHRWYFRQGDAFGCVGDLALLNGQNVELLCGQRPYDMTVRS